MLGKCTHAATCLEIAFDVRKRAEGTPLQVRALRNSRYNSPVMDLQNLQPGFVAKFSPVHPQTIHTMTTGQKIVGKGGHVLPKERHVFWMMTDV
jgi:hypothetical protein